MSKRFWYVMTRAARLEYLNIYFGGRWLMLFRARAAGKQNRRPKLGAQMPQDAPDVARRYLSTREKGRSLVLGRKK